MKFSEEEMDIFTKTYVESLTGKLVCISLGGKGSQWRYQGKIGNVESISVKPIDTTGAGDAFYAGILSQIDGVSRENWSEELFNRAFRFGNICGALNTLGRGAIDALPDLATVKSYL